MIRLLPFANSIQDTQTEFRVVKRILAGVFSAAILMGANASRAQSVVNITAPAESAIFVAPADIALSANTNPAGARISFYSGTTLVATAPSDPIHSIWHGVPAGSYTITATSTDYHGNVTTSAPRQVTVKENVPPTVALKAPVPVGDDIAPATVTLTATAADTDGSIVSVSYYRDGILIGTSYVAASSYSFDWMGVAAGTYSVTAHASDDKGVVTISEPVSVVVRPNILPSVSLTAPGNNTNYVGAFATFPLTAAASDADGRIIKVEFRSNGMIVGVGTVEPYTFIYRNVGIGSYRITATTTDNKGGVTVSAPADVTVTANAAPTASLTGPADNATFVVQASIPLTAAATDSDGTIGRVDFYSDGVLLGSSNAAPFQYNWIPSLTGTYSLTVRAIDDRGETSTISGPVSVTINANVAPTVNMTAPVADSRHPESGTLVLAADAADSDGTIAKVDFYSGTVLIGSDLTAPYTVNWPNVAAGTYSLSAKATDAQGVATTSAALSVTVVTVPLPTVSISAPDNNASYFAPASFTLTANAAVSGDTISKVEYISGPNLVGTATAAPYAVSLTNIGIGTYLVSARATGALGGTAMSAPVTLVVNANRAPVLTFEASPANAAAPAVIAFNASASDSDGSIAKVEFFNGDTLLATVTQAPYSYVWNGVGINSYQLTARATDNLGAVTTSIARTVTVTAPRGNTQMFYVYNDQINTAREITNGAGAIVWQADPDPFGANPPNENPAGQGQFTYNPRFPGQYFDRETGLHYNYYRDYDPQTGRYVQSDPIGLAGGLNTYSYVGSSPLIATDRFGLACPPHLKASGQCIDSSNYVAARDGTKTVAGDAASDSAALANMRRLDISATDENFGVINLNNTFASVSGSGTETVEGYEGSININPLTTKAICHSHPGGDTYSSAPGYADDGVVNGGYPNYIIRNGTIGVVERVNGQYQYRILKGRLTRPERRATETELDNYQKRACGCNG